MEDGIENCHESSLQAAKQVLLLFGPIENPRWPPSGDIIQHSDPTEQKVTTIDQNLVRNISAKHGSHPSSGS
jgi:hypothetical protein